MRDALDREIEPGDRVAYSEHSTSQFTFNTVIGFTAKKVRLAVQHPWQGDLKDPTRLLIVEKGSA